MTDFREGIKRPLSQAEVEWEIDRIQRLLESDTERYAELAVAAAEADADFKVSFAQSLLASVEKTIKMKEAVATVETHSKYLQKRIAEALADSKKEANRHKQAQLSALQSLLRSIGNLVGTT